MTVTIFSRLTPLLTNLLIYTIPYIISQSYGIFPALNIYSFHFTIPRSNFAHIEKTTFGLFHGVSPVDFEITGILITLS